MENILVLDRLCTWQSFSRLLLTGAATVLFLAGSLGIARGASVLGGDCASFSTTLAMASFEVPGSDTPCEFTISDFTLAPSSEGFINFSFVSAAGVIVTSFLYATNVGTEAEFCYVAYEHGVCPFTATGPLASNLGLGALGVLDSQDARGDLSSIMGSLTADLFGTVGGQPAALGLTIIDTPFVGDGGELFAFPVAIPEPSTYATLGIGVLAIVVFRRKIGRTV